MKVNGRSYIVLWLSNIFLNDKISRGKNITLKISVEEFLLFWNLYNFLGRIASLCKILFYRSLSFPIDKFNYPSDGL